MDFPKPSSSSPRAQWSSRSPARVVANLTPVKPDMTLDFRDSTKNSPRHKNSDGVVIQDEEVETPNLGVSHSNRKNVYSLNKPASKQGISRGYRLEANKSDGTVQTDGHGAADENTSVTPRDLNLLNSAGLTALTENSKQMVDKLVRSGSSSSSLQCLNGIEVVPSFRHYMPHTHRGLIS